MAKKDKPAKPAAGKAAKSAGKKGDAELRERVEQLEQEAAEAKDALMRAEADARNRIRRAEQDAERARKYALEPLMSDILPSIDNLERALAAAEGGDSSAEGLALCLKSLLDCLARHNLQPVDADGDFDPDVHEALGTCASELPRGRVAQLVQSGYKLHGRLVRPARVLVSSGPQEDGDSGRDSAEDADKDSSNDAGESGDKDAGENAAT